MSADTTELKHDAEVIGLVGFAHMLSHFLQLILAPLFPLLKEEFGVGYAALGCDLIRGQEELAHKACVFIIGHVRQPRDVLFRNNQNVHRRLRIEVVECYHELILVGKRTDVTPRDLAENAVFQICPPHSLFPIP